MAATPRRITVIALVLTVLALLAPVRADAQPYEGQTLTCTPTTVEQGGTVTCTLTGCETGDEAVFLWNGEPWASGVAASPVTVTAPVPPGTAPGPVTISAACNGGAVLSTQITVVASVSQATPVQVSPPATSTSLPVTGSDSISWLQIGLVLIAVGVLLVVATRKRGSTTSPTTS